MPFPSRFLCDKCARAVGGPWTLAIDIGGTSNGGGIDIDSRNDNNNDNASHVGRDDFDINQWTRDIYHEGSLQQMCTLARPLPWVPPPAHKSNGPVQWTEAETPRKAAWKHKSKSKSPLGSSKGALSKGSKTAVTKSTKTAPSKSAATNGKSMTINSSTTTSTASISAPNGRAIPVRPPLLFAGYLTIPATPLQTMSTFPTGGIQWRSPYIPAPTYAPHPQQYPIQRWSTFQPYSQGHFISAPAPASISSPSPFAPLFTLPPQTTRPLILRTLLHTRTRRRPRPSPRPRTDPPAPRARRTPRRIVLSSPFHSSGNENGKQNGVTPVIPYQTLALLLADLNRLLTTPHGGPGFDFQGTCAEIVGPRDYSGSGALANGKGKGKGKEKEEGELSGATLAAHGGADRMRGRVMKLAWDVLDQTVLAFNVHKLMVHTGETGTAAVATTRSSAIWMGDPSLLETPPAAVEVNGVQANGSKKYEVNGKKKGSAKEKSSGAKEGGAAQECPCKRCEHLLTIKVMLEETKYAVGVRFSVALLHFATEA
ncbi:hypothetical protein MSAN_01632100 [Mycena sanguinolenta]|uniref:Uncharacterized protein n=1 Tax=Mycena sanguinolenta TaxID=230812 RepID=A0A8H7CWL6_9AGAR|nr:hypothetical protein MSAN_01632100 [Mycena sanguinolenta]